MPTIQNRNLTFSGPSSSTFIISEPLVGIRVRQLTSDNKLKTTPNVGDSVTLICAGIGMNEGDSKLTYKWDTSANNGRFYTIASAAKSDVKTHTCTVTNGKGDSSSKGYALTVDGM